MAAGGQGSESTSLGADGASPGREPAPDITSIHLHFSQMSLHARQMSASEVRADSMDIQGPVFVNMNPYARYEPRQQRPPDPHDQALWPFPPPEDMTPHFTDDELSRAIEEKFLSFVANSCDQNSNWKRLARKLKLDSPSINRLEMYYAEAPREFIFQLLLTWKRRHPEARVRELIKILSDAKLQHACLELKKYFSSIHW